MSACGGILVVDDDLGIRETLAEVLAEEGYSVAIAEHGREALERMRVITPCVVLLDLSMPVMDGFQFRVEQLRDPQLAGVPVVVLSADGNPAVAAAAIRANRVLKKPVHLEEVLNCVGDFCRCVSIDSTVRPVVTSRVETRELVADAASSG
jgi:CheY-like chemotaxis protein